jgi:hypothetical protein
MAYLEADDDDGGGGDDDSTQKRELMDLQHCLDKHKNILV